MRSELIIRREFFGGIAIIINNGEFELDDFTTEFLLLFEETNDELQILEILNQNFNLKLSKSDIHEFIKQAKLFLIATYNTYSCENTIALANKMKMKRNNIKLINYLSAPLNVSIYPGMKCNLACDFCFISEEKWADNNIMFSLDEWKPVLDQIKEMKIPYLTILGGEPLLYRGIWEMLDYLDEIGQQTHITTNGTIYSKKIIQQLKKYPKLTLKVSIQALDDRHKLLTKGSLDRTLKFIKTVKKEGIRCGIHTLGLKETVDQIPNIAQFANDLGIDDFSMGVFFNINQIDIDEMTLNEYRIIGKKTQEYISENFREMRYRLEGCQIWTAEPTMKAEYIPQTPFEILKSGCDAAQSRLEILNDGIVLGCALFNKHDFGAGNIFEESLENIWHNSSVFSKLRNYKTDDSYCKKCSFSYFCNGGCPALNYKKTRKLDSGDERCRIRNEIYKGNLKPVKILN